MGFTSYKGEYACFVPVRKAWEDTAYRNRWNFKTLRQKNIQFDIMLNSYYEDLWTSALKVTKHAA